MISKDKVIKGYRNSPRVRLVKQGLLVVVLLLVVIDFVAFFTLKHRLMPTVSREVLHSVPAFLCIVWIAGIATVSVFFPQERDLSVGNRVLRQFITFAIIGGMLWGGLSLNKHTKPCSEGQISVDDVEWSWVRPMLIVECIKTGKDNYEEVDCNAVPVGEPCVTKFNLTVTSKLLIYLLGVVWGIFVWPQREYEDTI
jgi:hypothetical protein